jgi:hypothetical protein
LPGKERPVIQTDDIFLGAFGLVRGGELTAVEVRGINGRRLAFFHIEGPEVDEAERDYFRGTANVNLQLLKFQVRRLKDKAFDAIREEERRGHAVHHQGRAVSDQQGEPLRRHRR